MKTMLSLPELELWTRETIAGTEQEPFALAVIEAASTVVADYALHPAWIADDFPGPYPPRPKLVAVLLAKRSYLNPDSVISEGGIGPIGGDRYVEELAKFLVLTEQEKADLDPFRLIADPGSAGGGVWTMEIETGRTIPQDDTISLRDLDDRAGSWPLLSTRDFPELEQRYI